MSKTGEQLPSFFEAIEQGEEATCRTLWLSVILQQILDAKGKFGNSVTQRQAEIWLEGRGGITSDLAEVCRLAGVDFEKTRRRCAEILADETLLVDFRALKQDKEKNQCDSSRRRYFSRVARNERIRQERLEGERVRRRSAENDNEPSAANDNFINPTEEETHDQ